MTSSTTASIHPTAQVHETATIHPSAEIGEGAIIEQGVIVGPGCAVGARTHIRMRAMIVENVTMGEENDIHPYAVIGGDPQDRAFDGSVRGTVEIGSRNVLREYVTINRSTGTGRATSLGDDNFMMTQAHIAHNAKLGSRTTMANGASLAGHSTVGDGCVLSAFVGIHQFTVVSDMIMFRAHSGASMHVPPYVVVVGHNIISGLNRVGLERNPAFTDEDRTQIKQLYRTLYRERGGRSLDEAIANVRDQAYGEPAERFLKFIEDAIKLEKPYERGIIRQR